MFFDYLVTSFNGCIYILNLPLSFSPFHFSLWQVIFGAAIIGVVARMIWGTLE